MTKKLSGAGIRVSQLHGCDVEWAREGGKINMQEVPGSDFTMQVDLVLLAMGFLHVKRQGLVAKLDLEMDSRGNVVVDKNQMTAEPGVFAAGDTSMGASLIVHAINLGRQAAAGINRWLASQEAGREK